MKKYIIGFVIGAIIFSGIAISASTEIFANTIKYKSTTVDKALDDLYNRSSSDLVLAAMGSIAFSSGVTAETNVPNTSNVSSLVTINNDNTIKVNKAGKYVMVIEVGSNVAKMDASSYTGHIKVYVNDTQEVTCSASYSTFCVNNKILDLNANDVIKITYRGDGGSYNKIAHYRLFGNE